MFVNGQEIDGALPVSDVRQVLDRALQQAGVPAPSHAEAMPPKAAQPNSK
jgi:hypothetical protein